MKSLSSEFFDRLWQEERGKSSLYSRQPDSAVWEKFWDQYAPTYLKAAKSLIPENKKLIKQWQGAGLINKNSRVLDIGCGPGTLALPLGEVVGEVVALDLSSRMLEMVTGEAKNLSLSSIQVKQGNWEELDYNKNFDLVLAANSPAIYDFKTLMKMTQAAKKYCLYICYASKMGSPLRSILWERIMGENMHGKTFNIIYPLNILYQEGFLPNLSFHEQSHSYLEQTEVVIENYRAYFEIFGKHGLDIDRLLEKQILKEDVNGQIEETLSCTLAVMWWKVPIKDKTSQENGNISHWK